jgi:hypothetical protein
MYTNVSTVVDTWFSLNKNFQEDSRNKKNQIKNQEDPNNILIQRIENLENELKKSLGENKILKEQIRKYENIELQRLNKKRVIYLNIYQFS